VFDCPEFGFKPIHGRTVLLGSGVGKRFSVGGFPETTSQPKAPSLLRCAGALQMGALLDCGGKAERRHRFVIGADFTKTRALAQKRPYIMPLRGRPKTATRWQIKTGCSINPSQA